MQRPDGSKVGAERARHELVRVRVTEQSLRDRDGRQLSQLLCRQVVELGEMMQRLLETGRMQLLARQLLSELLCRKLQRDLKRRVGRGELLWALLLRRALQPSRGLRHHSLERISLERICEGRIREGRRHGAGYRTRRREWIREWIDVL
jgi:hypothetical protein